MPYDPTNWKDRAVERPRTYNLQPNPDGTVTLIPVPGTVYEPGTPVSAGNMNKIEQGIAAAVPLDGSAVMTGDLEIAKNEPALVLKDLNDDYYSKITCDLDALFIEQRRTSDDSYVATRIKIDLTTGEIYAGDASKTVWNTSTLRWNGGNLEYNDGGTWKPVTGYVPVNKAGDTMTGGLTVPAVDVTGNGGNNLRLIGSDHVYLQFFPQGLGAGRKAFIGFAGSGGKDISIANEATDGDINLSVNGTGAAKVNGNRIWDASMLRVNNGVLEFWTGGAWQPVGGIKGVQRGYTSINFGENNPNKYQDIAISAVDPSKTQLNLLTNTASGLGNTLIRLINATTIRFEWSISLSGVDRWGPISWEAIESY